MSVVVTLARQVHRVLPFAQLRTAKWILRNHQDTELDPIQLFGYEMPLQARTTVHVLLSLEGEKWVEDRFLLEPYLHEGMVVMDVGANIGYLTLYFCRRVGERGAVFAFEPEKDNFRELAHTIARNRIDWCTPVNCACGAAEQEASISPGLNGYIQPNGAGDSTCHMVSLDSFAAQHNIRKVDLVKIDVEGFEANVLNGMSEILRRDRPILYVEVHPPGFCGSGDPRKVCSNLKNYYRHISAFRIWGDVRHRLPMWSKVRASFGAPQIVRHACETTLDEVMDSKQHRYQLLALP